MPRTKKPPGQAADRRNGRQLELAAAPVRRFGLPRREPPWHAETRKAWRALWDDPVLTSVLTPVDRPVLLRWADAIDRAMRALALADENPEAKGSMGQAVENPLYGVADKAIRVAQACEAQLGIGALNRARLGIAVIQEKASAMDLWRQVDDGGSSSGGDEPDPRLSA